MLEMITQRLEKFTDPTSSYTNDLDKVEFFFDVPEGLTFGKGFTVHGVQKGGLADELGIKPQWQLVSFTSLTGPQRSVQTVHQNEKYPNMAAFGEDYLSSSAMGKVITKVNDPEVVLCGVRRFFDVEEEEDIKSGKRLPLGFASNRAAVDKVCKDNFADPLFFDEEPVNRPKAKQDDVNDLKDLKFEEGMFVSAEKYKAKEQAVWEKILNRAAASSKLNKDKKKRARQAKLFELGKEFILDKLKLIDANTQRMAREDPEGAQDRAIERMWSESKKDKDMEKWMKVLREMGIVKSSESYAPG